MKRIVQAIMMAGVLTVLRVGGAEDANEQEPSRDEHKGQSTVTVQTPETISGEVLCVDKVQSREGGGEEVVLEVRTERGTIPVHLGPARFLENQRMHIKPNDQVEVTGTRVAVEEKEALIASQVKKGGQVLKLRDETTGQPARVDPATGQRAMDKTMAEQHQKIRQQHEKMVAQMQAMEAQLDKKVAEMNESQGEAKVNAMAEVINQLIKERKAMLQMAGMSEQKNLGEENTGMGAPGDEEVGSDMDEDDEQEDDGQYEGD